MYRVQIDPKVCSGTSNCVEEAPEAYEMDDRGSMAHLRAAAPGVDLDEAILRGAEACPVQAIHVFDAVTGRRVYP